MTENEMLNEIDRQETTYTGVYLGCKTNCKKDKPDEEYGVISLYYKGQRQTGEPWYTVQEQYMPVEKMKQLTTNIPFGANVKATFSCGNTPGGKQKICKLEQI